MVNQMHDYEVIWTLSLSMYHTIWFVIASLIVLSMLGYKGMQLESPVGVAIGRVTTMNLSTLHPK